MAGNRNAMARPGRDRISLRWYRDWTTLSSAAVLLALAPLTIVCLLPFAFVAAALLPGNLTMWIVAYFAVVPLAVIPGLEFLQVILVGQGTRQPTPQERARLAHAWQSVQSQIPHGGRRRWRMRVIDVDAINASAAGGSLVMVTSYALRALPDDELQAVLAHELGHHAGMHPLILIMQSWLIRPILLADWLAVKLHNAIGRVMNLSREHTVVCAVMLAVQLVLRAAVLILQLIVTTAVRILLHFQRKAEHKADHTAVTLGFGAGLLKALSRFHVSDASYKPAVNQWQNTHPSPDSRIIKIQQRMQSL